MSRRVLVLSYYYPPAGGPGVQRVLKFTKYLADFDWEPLVITVENGEFPARDETMLDEIPKNMLLFRFPAWEPFSIYKKLTGRKNEEGLPVGMLAKDDSSSGAEGLSRWIRRNIFIPDARIGWMPPVLMRIGRIINEMKPDLLFSSSPPHSLQLIAGYIAKKYKLPWIADLRDPWTDIYYYQDEKRSHFAARLDRYFEKSVLQRADRIITVSPSLQRSLKITAPTADVRMIPNGFEKSDMESGQIDRQNYDKFTLAYIGNFKANQHCPELWAALKDLSEIDSGFAENLQVNFIGMMNAEVKADLEESALSPYLNFEQYLPHHKAVERMLNASVLLFIIPFSRENKGILTGKIFEYLASGTPMLSIGPVDGDASEIINECRAAPMIDYNDRAALNNRIKEFFEAWKSKSLADFSPDLKIVEDRFERKQLTRQLSEIYNELINE